MPDLPEDKEALQAMVRALLLERDKEQQHAEAQASGPGSSSSAATICTWKICACR